MVAVQQGGQAKKLSLKPNVPYCCSFNLVLKILEIALSLASLIVVLRFNGNGAVIFIEIISTLALVTAISWCILYAINMSASFPDFFPKLMIIYHAVMCLLFIAATACAAYLWPMFKISIFPEFVICTFTSAAAALMFLIDTIISIMWSRGSAGEFIVYPCYPYEPHVIH